MMMAKEMIQLPMGINMAAWDEWCEWRRTECKKKVGPLAANKQFKLLLTYSEEDQQKIIDHSISNSYQGLFPLKEVYQPAVTGMLGAGVTVELFTDKPPVDDGMALLLQTSRARLEHQA